MSWELGRPRFKTGEARTGWDGGSEQVWPEPRRQREESGQPGLRSTAGEEVKRKVLGGVGGLPHQCQGLSFPPPVPSSASFSRSIFLSTCPRSALSPGFLGPDLPSLSSGELVNRWSSSLWLCGV